MKKLILLTFALAAAGVFAAETSVSVKNAQIGTGTPAQTITVGDTAANLVADGLYHVPQYLPYNPTAGTFPTRVIEVECDSVMNELKCDGFNWVPAMGRAEYLMIKPVMRVEKAAEITPASPIPPAPIFILKEVPVKKKAE